MRKKNILGTDAALWPVPSLLAGSRLDSSLLCLHLSTVHSLHAVSLGICIGGQFSTSQLKPPSQEHLLTGAKKESSDLHSIAQPNSDPTVSSV